MTYDAHPTGVVKMMCILILENGLNTWKYNRGFQWYERMVFMEDERQKAFEMSTKSGSDAELGIFFKFLLDIIL